MDYEEEHGEAHTVDLSSPDCHAQLKAAIARHGASEIEIPDYEVCAKEANNEMINGNLVLSGIVVIRVKVQPVKLATYRDPITRRKAGHTPQNGGRKRSFPYPDASIADDALSILEWEFGICHPATLRMIALLAEPETIQIGGDLLLLKSLVRQTKFAMRAFKLKRFREPFQRFIDALERAIARLQHIQ